MRHTTVYVIVYSHDAVLLIFFSVSLRRVIGRGLVSVLHCFVRNFFIEPPPDTQRKEKQGERGIWVAISCYLLHATPPPLLQLPPSPHRASVAPPAATLSGLAEGRLLPPPPTHSPCRILAISGDLGQSRGRPLFRSPKVLQLNLDSNCHYVRIFGSVIGHLDVEIDFWLFPRKWWKFRCTKKIWQSAAILTSRAGTTAGTVRERCRSYKLGGLSPQITWGLHAREATSLERELFSQTWRKSAVGDSAEPK